MGLINAIGAWFQKISDGWVFGSQLHKLIFRKNAEIVGTDDMLYEYQFQPKTGIVAHLDDIYPAVERRYESTALMIADQATQKNQYLYFDGGSYWEYLGTTNGNISDYRLIGGAESFVPYIGAVDDVDLGEFGLKAGNLKFDTTPTDIPTDQGTTYWDDAKQTIALIMNGTTQHLGHDVYFHVKNSSGATILKGRNVRFAGTDGASGHLLVEEFLADGTFLSDYYMGVTTEDIPNGSFGKVTFFGELRGVDTSMYPAGTLLYASTTVPGAFQTTAPTAPNNIVLIAATISSKINGEIFVRPTIGSNINKDEGVRIVNPVALQGLIYNDITGLWENQPIPQMLENGLISGGVVQWTRTGYTFNISSALYRIGGVLYTSPADVISLSAPDPVNNRIDVFAVDSNGDVVVLTGAPAALPVKPQIDPLTQIELTSIIVSAASVGPTLIEEAIYLENVEWVGSFSGVGTANFASTVNPDKGSLATEVTSVQNGSAIVWTRNSDLNISSYQTLGLRLNLKAAMGGAQNIRVEFLDNSNNPVSTALNLPIDKVLTGAYQFIGIVLAAFTFTSTTVRKIRFTFLRATGSVFFDGFYMDEVRLEGGINPPVSLDTFLNLLDTPSSYSGSGKKVVSVKENESGLEFTDIPSPVSNSYASSALMISDQANQLQGYIYYDGTLYYEYLGTTNGDLSDYNQIGGGSVATSDNEVMSVFINPLDLSGTGSLEQQVCDYVNSNVSINYTTDYSKINFVIGVDPAIPFPSAITVGDGVSGEGIAAYGPGLEWAAIPWFQTAETIANFETEYELYLSFGDPVSTPSVPDGHPFLSERLQGFMDLSGWYASPGPSGDSVNNNLVLASTTPPYITAPQIFLPVRIRFRHKATGVTSLYYYGTMNVVYV